MKNISMISIVLFILSVLCFVTAIYIFAITIYNRNRKKSGAAEKTTLVVKDEILMVHTAERIE